MWKYFQWHRSHGKKKEFTCWMAVHRKCWPVWHLAISKQSLVRCTCTTQKQILKVHKDRFVWVCQLIQSKRIKTPVPSASSGSCTAAHTLRSHNLSVTRPAQPPSASSPAQRQTSVQKMQKFKGGILKKFTKQLENICLYVCMCVCSVMSCLWHTIPLYFRVSFEVR